MGSHILKKLQYELKDMTVQVTEWSNCESEQVTKTSKVWPLLCVGKEMSRFWSNLSKISRNAEEQWLATSPWILQSSIITILEGQEIKDSNSNWNSLRKSDKRSMVGNKYSQSILASCQKYE